MKEQQTKYPWHIAPDWAMWADTDEDGSKYFYEKVPYIQGAYWKKETGSLAVFFITPSPESVDWQNSLEKRPTLLHGVCTNCENAVSKPLHLCPYKQEVEGDHVSLCNCCTNCEMTCNPFST